MQQFQWSPDLGAIRAKSPRVEKIEFGDGYEARFERGLNSNPNTWDCMFTYPIVIANQILAFLDARRAVEAFKWTDPMNKTGIYICREWTSAQNKFGLWEIKAKFEQLFESET